MARHARSGTDDVPRVPDGEHILIAYLVRPEDPYLIALCSCGWRDPEALFVLESSARWWWELHAGVDTGQLKE